jgi:hypothetical protein
MHLGKHSSYLLILLTIANSFICSARAGESLLTYQKNQTPTETGMRLVKNLLNRKDYMLYKNEGLHYAEACAAYSAYRFASLTGDKELLAELNRRYGSVFDTNGLISKKPHVDQAVIGILPLEIFMRTGDKKFLELGLSFADRQWQDPQEDGLTNQTRWWIDDMYGRYAADAGIQGDGRNQICRQGGITNCCISQKAAAAVRPVLPRPRTSLLLGTRERLGGVGFGRGSQIFAAGPPPKSPDYGWLS